MEEMMVIFSENYDRVPPLVDTHGAHAALVVKQKRDILVM